MIIKKLNVHVQSSKSFSDININKTKLYENFINIKNIANLNILVCYKELFSKKGIIKNIGCYIIIPIIIFYFVCLIIFYKKDLKLIYKYIKQINFAIKNHKYIQEKTNKKDKKDISNELNQNNNKKRNRNKIKINNTQVNNEIKINNLITQNEDNLKYKKNIVDDDDNNNNSDKYIINRPKQALSFFKRTNNLHKKHSRKKPKENSSPPNKNSKNKGKEHNSKKINIDNRTNKTKIKRKIKKILKLNITELNDLEYKVALKLDNRKYCEYYLSLLKTKHIFLFSFILKRDYNSRIIKIFLFLFNFIIYYFVNALFFSDATMHKIYEDGGSFNFEYQIPQILYSSIASGILNSLIKILAISETKIIEFKKIRTIDNLDKQRKEIEFYLFYKFIAFFVVSFIFMMFFWYYLACFCAIYSNTLVHLINDTLISFGLSMIYPFGWCLIPGIFRIPSLSSKKNKKIFFYKISQLIEILI